MPNFIADACKSVAWRYCSTRLAGLPAWEMLRYEARGRRQCAWSFRPEECSGQVPGSPGRSMTLDNTPQQSPLSTWIFRLLLFFQQAFGTQTRSCLPEMSAVYARHALSAVWTMWSCCVSVVSGLSSLKSSRTCWPYTRCFGRAPAIGVTFGRVNSAQSKPATPMTTSKQAPYCSRPPMSEQEQQVPPDRGVSPLLD